MHGTGLEGRCDLPRSEKDLVRINYSIIWPEVYVLCYVSLECLQFLRHAISEVQTIQVPKRYCSKLKHRCTLDSARSTIKE